jgi:hypothetical protein
MDRRRILKKRCIHNSGKFLDFCRRQSYRINALVSRLPAILW